MPPAASNIDTGDFDPIEQELIVQVQDDDRMFRKVATAMLLKQTKHCNTTAGGLSKRVGKLEKWRTWLAGGTAVAVVLVPVIWWLLHTYVFKK